MNYGNFGKCSRKQKKAFTNADRIRDMSDSDLADLLHNIGSYVENGNPFIDIYIGNDKVTIDDSYGHILEWLAKKYDTPTVRK